MIKRVRLLYLGFLAVVAVGAVASASASAAGCTAEAGATCIAVLVAGVETLEASVELAAKANGNQLVEIPALKTDIVCTGVSVNAGNVLLEVAGSSAKGEKIFLDFTGCGVPAETSCKVSDPRNKLDSLVETNELLATVGLTAGSPDVTFAEVGANFMDIEIAGCLKALSIGVTGSQLCTTTDSETDQLEHEIGCTSAGGSLATGGKPVIWEGKALLKLAGALAGDSWFFKYEAT